MRRLKLEGCKEYFILATKYVIYEKYVCNFPYAFLKIFSKEITMVKLDIIPYVYLRIILSLQILDIHE